MNKPKTASDTVKTQLASLTLENNKLLKERDHVLAENQLLRKQNVELASVIENDLKAEAKMRIMAMSNYKEPDLEKLNIEQLQQIEKTLTMSKGDVEVPYKSIRAGVASKGDSRLTVGDLFGKTRKDILESGGDF